MSAASDALVLFGATGDLSKKKICPAVYEMAASGQCTVPVVGVASSEWNDERLRAYARESVAADRDVDDAVWSRLASTMYFVQRRLPRPCGLREAAGEADGGRSQAAALLPGHPAFAVRRRHQGHRPARPRPDARVVVEKPFGRDLESSRRAQRGRPPGLPRGERLPHRPLPRQGASREPARLPVRQLAARAHVEPQLHLQRADHHGRGLRRRWPWPLLRLGRRHPRRRAEPPAPGRRAAGDGATGRQPTRGRCATST